jgi:hypothetical protein
MTAPRRNCACWASTVRTVATLEPARRATASRDACRPAAAEARGRRESDGSLEEQVSAFCCAGSFARCPGFLWRTPGHRQSGGGQNSPAPLRFPTPGTSRGSHPPR